MPRQFDLTLFVPFVSVARPNPSFSRRDEGIEGRAVHHGWTPMNTDFNRQTDDRGQNHPSNFA
jgi:hypothetical protein